MFNVNFAVINKLNTPSSYLPNLNLSHTMLLIFVRKSLTKVLVSSNLNTYIYAKEKLLIQSRHFSYWLSSFIGFLNDEAFPCNGWLPNGVFFLPISLLRDLWGTKQTRFLIILVICSIRVLRLVYHSNS